MIGVKCPLEQAAAVTEFFELFKTSWEFFQLGRAYDVVVATVPETLDIEAKLIVVYSASTNDIDAELEIVSESRHQGGVVDHQKTFVPIYGRLLTFASAGRRPLLTVAGQMAGLMTPSNERIVLRIGYDLFEEVRFLLSTGQPIGYAHIPTLDLHIAMLREWILRAGISLVEIMAAPFGRRFAVCLTHDIDFAGIRQHRFDHSMWGFLYRATIGSVLSFARRRLSFSNLLRCWRAAISLPFVFLGWAKDFWEPFEWYLNVENGLPSTYFFIPFKLYSGEKVPGRHASFRAASYDVRDLSDQLKMLLDHDCEVGVHGLDSWHDPEKGRHEIARIAEVSGQSVGGVRMHWLLQDVNTPEMLEQAGYIYDSTCGYNETVGYRAGTGQVFRFLNARKLLELPLHIQDGALFYPKRLDLTNREAQERCKLLIESASRFGGVLTILWHDRSHGPERFWGAFYTNLLKSLRFPDVWFGTAAQVVSWFSKRRDVRFQSADTSEGSGRITLHYGGETIVPSLNVRIYRPGMRVDFYANLSSNFLDTAWNGDAVQLERLHNSISESDRPSDEYIPASTTN